MVSTIVSLVNEALALSTPEVGGEKLEELSEDKVLEAIDRGNAEGGKEGEFWTCDPIDGTLGTFSLLFFSSQKSFISFASDSFYPLYLSQLDSLSTCQLINFSLVPTSQLSLSM